MKKWIGMLLILVLIFSFGGCNRENHELSDERLAEVVRVELGVPDEKNIEYSISEMYYWDAAGRYYKNIAFTQNGETVAGAGVDPYTGELLKNIMEYDSLK